MSRRKLPSLRTPPQIRDNPSLQRWLMDVKTTLENIDLTAIQANVTVTDEQIADLVANGLKGADGINGAPGAPGAPGQTSYFHIAYADSADGSVNFNQVSGTYIGTYVDFTATDSANFNDYSWSKFVGTDGIPGTNGIDGQTSYLHIKYSPDGLVFSGNNGEDVDAWIGTYVDFVATDSNTFGDYTWKKIEGDQGAQGPQGDTGLASYFYTAYGDDEVGTNFSLTYTNQAYMGTYTSHSATQSTNPADYVWVLIKGADGGGIPLDSVTPVALTGLTAIPSRTFTILTWDPVPAQNDAQHTNIWRNGIDDPLTASIIGTSKSLIYQDYTQSDGNYYYWISSQSRGSVNTPEGIDGGISGAGVLSAVDSKITSANAGQYLAFDAIGSDFIAASSLAALSATLGNVTAGTLANGDGTFLIDLINKFIEIAGPAGKAADDYIRIENGNIQQFEWTGVTHQPGANLKTIEAGTAFNGSTIVLSKYYSTQPKIIVTAHDTPIYKAANSGQDQKIQIRAENVTENPPGSGSWQFNAVSRLVLSDSSVNDVINTTIGASSSNTLTSAVYTTPPNSASTNVSVDLTSIRSTAAAGTNYLRTVTWNIYYRTAGSSDLWTQVNAGATAIGMTLGAVTDTQLVTYPSSGNWEFYVDAIYSDAGGTWNSGGGGIEYATEVITNSTPSAVAIMPSESIEFIHYKTVHNLANHTHDGSWSIDSVNYSIDFSYHLYSAYHFDMSPKIVRLVDWIRVIDLDIAKSSSRTRVAEKGDHSLTTIYNQTFSISNYVQNIEYGVYGFSSDNNNLVGQSHAEVQIKSATATINFSRPIQASETPSNTLTINNFNHNLSGASVLQEGTLGWQAIL